MKLRKRFGQHLLNDAAVIEKLARHINPRPNENILEIGPGTGALTEKLLTAQARLTAIEIDRDMADILRRRFSHADGQLNLIVNDILKEDLMFLHNTPMRVVGNLPYNISTPLLMRLVDYPIPEMWLMMQEEVANRLSAKPSDADYGRLSVLAGLTYDIDKIFSVSPSAFFPPPKVRSAVIRLRRQDKTPPFSPLLPMLIKAAFQSPRKMLKNNLADFCVNWEDAKINPRHRAQTLSGKDFARLARHAQKII